MTTDIFNQLSHKATQIERNWNTLYQNLMSAQPDNPHLDFEHFGQLNETFQAALKRLHDDLNAPTLILATTGTTSSGKSTIVNLLCGADLMPRMAQEMSAGVVYINHSPEGKRHLKIHPTSGALWECGECLDLADTDIRDKLTAVMDSFNKSKGINQPQPPHIELTYPLVCFSNPSLLALASLPKNTQFQLMDLPGLRNHQDNTNAEIIQKCREALCLVAYNMEETDENRRMELVRQVLEQIKHMGGSPARMLFVLNRIDAFLVDHEPERRRDEHVAKVKKEIAGILYDKLPEHRDALDNLSYSRLSSLPALYVSRIKTGADRVQVAKELETHFKSLIPGEIIDDLPRKPDNWKDYDFERIGEAVWQNSYGAEFFAELDRHIQLHFPVLVIPSMVQRFEKEVSDAIGELARTCYSELNSSEEAFKAAEVLLFQQNAELRQFLGETKNTLMQLFENLLDDLKKKPGDTIVFNYFAEDLLATDIYRNLLTVDKLHPLSGWVKNLRDSTSGILDAMKQSLDKKDRDFSDTSVEQLPERLQQQLANACKAYCEERGGNIFEDQLKNFLNDLNDVINEVIILQSELENSRIRETIELLMRLYLGYLQKGIDHIAPEWNLSIGHHVLAELTPPKLEPICLKSNVEHRKIEERIWWTLWIATKTISWDELPSSYTLREQGRIELERQIESLTEPFHGMILEYFLDLNAKIAEEQNRVLTDFGNKLTLAHQQNQNDHDKTLCHWQSLLQKSEQLLTQLKQLVYHWESL